jgi:dsDNA-specific endonuclease/ATPase MutS2
MRLTTEFKSFKN